MRQSIHQLATVLLLLLPALVAGAKADRPNIIYIMTDDHAAQMMSAYDSSRASTPNLDRIGEEGILFRNSFNTNSLCAPSRATLLTGKYSHKHGQLSNLGRFNGAQQTFPKLLRRAGYQTAIIGKWHLGSPPTGFDYSNVLPGQGEYIDPVLIEQGKRKRHTGYVTDIITDLAIDWIRGRDKTRPFCLLYHHKAPHAEFIPAPEHEHLFDDEQVAEPVTFNDDSSGRAEPIRNTNNRIVPGLLKIWKIWGENHRKESAPKGLEGEALRKWLYQQYVKDYKRVMHSVDQNVGRLLDFLKDQGLEEDTMVIYTADNGMFIGDHNMYDKRLVHEESLRIPLVIRYPKMIKPGSVTDLFSLNIDYAPTILDIAGVKVPGDMQGRSLRPILEGEGTKGPRNWRRAIYYHYYEPAHRHRVPLHYAVRTHRFKLIHYYTIEGGDLGWELIDLKEDPHEYRNVIDLPEYQGAVRDLRQQMNRLRRKFEVPGSHGAARPRRM